MKCFLTVCAAGVIVFWWVCWFVSVSWLLASCWWFHQGAEFHLEINRLLMSSSPPPDIRGRSVLIMRKCSFTLTRFISAQRHYGSCLLLSAFHTSSSLSPFQIFLMFIASVKDWIYFRKVVDSSRQISHFCARYRCLLWWGASNMHKSLISTSALLFLLKLEGGDIQIDYLGDFSPNG